MPRVANIPAIRRCVRHVIPFTQVVAESFCFSTLLTSFCTLSGFTTFIGRAAATFIGRAATTFIGRAATFVYFLHNLFLIFSVQTNPSFVTLSRCRQVFFLSFRHPLSLAARLVHRGFSRRLVLSPHDGCHGGFFVTWARSSPTRSRVPICAYLSASSASTGNCCSIHARSFCCTPHVIHTFIKNEHQTRGLYHRSRPCRHYSRHCS